MIVAKRLPALLLTIALLGALSTTAATSAVAAPTSASAVLAALAVAPEATTPDYSRSYFEHWVDADDDGCDTRAEVLKRSTTAAVSFTSACTVSTGSWTSAYDGAAWTAASDVDVDHMVPLQEAWQSGAAAWTADQRRAYANDLDYAGSLLAVTDNVNQSKGARDPAEWLPPLETAQCEYLTNWTVVKWRWSLTIDAAEAAVLAAELVGTCSDPAIELPARAAVPGPTTAGPFLDVASTHPFVTAITWLSTEGITSGYSDGTFLPGQPVSRQAFAVYLYRYTHAGSDAPACTSTWFGDVPTNKFCGAITWLASTGIANGYSDGTFMPSAPISRQAAAAFLQRYRASADPSVSNTCEVGKFADVTSASKFCGAVTWLATTGIANGYSDGTFLPTASVTRQALAAYLLRYDGSYDRTSPPIVVSPPVVTPPVVTPPVVTPPVVTTPANPGDTKNCGDFRSQAEAQAWFDFYYPYYEDIARLDANNDRIPCESLP